MKTVYTYFKNSNTGDVVMKQEFKELSFEQPPYYYRNKKAIDAPDLTGYVEISEKKYLRESKKQLSTKTNENRNIQP